MPTVADIERHMEEILSRPEFLERSPTIWERALQALGSFFGRLFSGLSAFSGALGAWGVVVFVLLLGLAVFLAVRLSVRYRRGRGGLSRRKDASAPAVNMTASDWLRKADASARDAPDSAVAALMAALLAHLNERGLIRFEAGRTNRQYLSDLTRGQYGGARDFADFSTAFAAFRYGGEPATFAHYQTWRARLSHILTGRAVV